MTNDEFKSYDEFKSRYRYNPATDRLGKGGFGSVFKAYDTYLNRFVAIKIAPVTPGNEKIRLRREVEIAKELPANPNIAHYESCHTFAFHDGESDIGILQYYEEGNLLQLLKSGKLTDSQKYSILKQVIAGLDFLHGNGIIHRDMKPHNILMAKWNNDYIPKITDFGISKKLSADESSLLGNSLEGAGTIAYASPEQLSERNIRHNTDLWSFGVIAYQVLTGELPFNSGTYNVTSAAGQQELMRQISSGCLPDNIDHIPEPWQELIRRCLVVDKEKRVRKCGECLAILEADNDRTIVDASTPATPYQPAPPKPTILPKPPKPEPKPTSELKLPRNLKPIWIGLGGLGIILLLIFLLRGTKSDDPNAVPTDTVAQQADTIPTRPPLIQLAPSTTTKTVVTLPVLAAVTVTDITENSARMSSRVVNTGKGKISARGLCYDTSRNPSIGTIAVRIQNTGKGNKIVSSQASLSEGTTYYVRAYAINEAGIGYSEEISFSTLKAPTTSSSENYGQLIERNPLLTIKQKEPEEQTIFEVVENAPEFPGGQDALLQFLAKNVKYPTIAQENGVQGRVIVQFVVNRDGSVVDPVVVRSVDPYLDQEALRVVGTMPKWKPGMQRGKAVRVKYTVPVMFRLQ